MPRLTWDKISDRVYEIGVDHGVLYIPDDEGILRGFAWSGLTGVTHASSGERTPVYYDGAKIHDFLARGEFSGSLRAITYPPQFEEVEGYGDLKCGVSIGDQPPKTFCLCYRSMIGDYQGRENDYKLHILYNLIATPSEKVYATKNDGVSLMEFEWDLTSIPEPIEGFRPTSEIILDSRHVDPLMMESLEAMLLGSPTDYPVLPSMIELVAYIALWFRFKVTLTNPNAELGDPDYGVFTIEDLDGTHLTVDEDAGTFEITGVDATLFKGPGSEIWDVPYIPNPDGWQEVWYFLSDSDCGTKKPLVSIVDNEDGSWSASSDQAGVITINDDPESPLYGYFTISEATVLWSGDSSYRITDTIVE